MENVSIDPAHLARLRLAAGVGESAGYERIVRGVETRAELLRRLLDNDQAADRGRITYTVRAPARLALRGSVWADSTRPAALPQEERSR